MRRRDPQEATAALDRIAERVKNDPKAAARLRAYVERQAEAERDPSPSDVTRQAIRESGLSLQELARRTGVQAAVLSRFVRGTRGIACSTLDALAGELGLVLVRRRGKAPRRKR